MFSLNLLSVIAFSDAAKSEPNALAFDIDLLLFTIVVFVALVALLGAFVWRPILDGLDKRERAIADEIEGAKLANERAQKSLAEYEQRLAAVTKEANDILAQARKDADAAKERILAEASEESRRQSERAVADINAAREAAVRELAEKSAETAVDLAGRIVGRSLNKSDHKQLIDESVNSFASQN